MFLYNMTVGIDKDVEQEWLQWIVDEHFPKVMDTGMFVDYKIYKVLHDQEEGSVSYSVEKYAPAILEEQRIRFRDKHIAFMTLLEQIPG